MNRPLVWVAAGLLGGAYAAAFDLVSGVAGAAALGIGGFVALAFLRRYTYCAPAGFALVFAAAGVMLWEADHLGPPGDALSRFAAERSADANYRIEGRVERPDLVLPEQPYTQFVLCADEIEIRGARYTVRGGVLVRWSNPGGPVYPGERVRVFGKLEHALGHVNPGTPSVEDHYRRSGVHTAVRVYGPEGVERVAPGPWWSPAYLAGRWRQRIAEKLNEAVPPESMPFVLTVWLGDRRRIDAEAYQSFLQSGTAHILAVSGVHMGIVFIAAMYVLRVVVPRRRARSLAVIAFVAVFALITGARVSSVRAAIMLGLYSTADALEREPDAPTALSIAALLFAAIEPDLLFDAGFVLSFISIASILCFQGPIRERLSALPYSLREGMSVSFGVQILPLPAAIAFFHVLPLTAPLANLVVVPLLFVCLCLCALATFFAFPVPPVGLLFGHALDPVVRLIGWIADRTAGIPGSHMNVTTPTAMAVACYLAAAFGFWGWLRYNENRRYWAAASAIFVILSAALWSPISRRPEITFLDVGHGDATFIRTPRGTTLLVDGGDRTDFTDHGARTVAPFLWSNGVKSLDYVVATHPDRDHIGGLLYILEHFRVGELWLGPFVSDSPEEAQLLAASGRRGVPVRRVVRGDRLEAGGALVEVLHPPKDWPEGSSDNDQSLVLRVSWPGVRVLLTGDIEVAAERAVASGDCSADVLKAPHHGSITSSAEVFIDSVAPKEVVVSTGRRPQGTVLSRRVLQRYADRSIPAYRTDIHGGLRLTTPANGWTITGARAMRGYPLPPES